MTHTTVLLIVDAGRADFVRDERMPFLAGLAREAASGSFRPTPGFAPRTLVFTGRYPDASGQLGAFVYDPEASPFRWVRGLGPLKPLLRPRRFLYPGRAAIGRVTRWTSGVPDADPAWIPPHFLPYFRPCESRMPPHEVGAFGSPSIFDLCRENGRRVRFLARPECNDDEWNYHTLIKELRESQPYDLYVADFNDVDAAGHQHGPHSEEARGVLRVLDERLASIHAALGAGYDSWDFLVVGTHGMMPVGRRIDVQAAIRSSGARPGKDYVVFVHSTMAVFWYLSDLGRQAIEQALSEIPGTRVVDGAERLRMRIPLDRRWGDRILATEPGVIFSPDYFHAAHSPVRGMHGYVDPVSEGRGLAVHASSRTSMAPRSLGERSLADVFPTLCDWLRVPTPLEQEGTLLPAGGPARLPEIMPEVIAHA